MGTAKGGASARVRKALLAGVAAIACVAAGTVVPDSAHAQQLDLGFESSPDAEMLLEADTLVYDRDRNTISAVGGVQIDYDGHRLVADRVTYDRNTARLMASGRVEILDRDGNRFFADEIDITDDFRDGFVQALQVHTADDTFFAAESAERVSGTVTTFRRGIYTACRPCEERPDKPPIWRIGAQKIIWDGQARTVRFERARFEFFGMPIAFLPFLEMPDPTVRQKSGFLTPSITYKTELGVGVSVPYYLALAPTYDLTVRGTYYTQQGFLGEAEWRQRFESGGYNLRIAGISQRTPEAFTQEYRSGGVAYPGVDASHRQRGLVSSRGHFDINPRWSFGWDVMVQSDKNFGRTYRIAENSDSVRVSQAYLTGLNDRNYFDLRGYHFQVQEDRPDSHPRARNPRQPWVLPSFDYHFTPDEPVAGGEVNLTLNAQSLHRREFDGTSWDETAPLRVRGADGHSARITAEAEWKRSLIAPGGIVVTPLLHARGDAIYANFGQDAMTELNEIGADVRSAYYRYMATAGMEVRWPVLFSTASSTHILEPTAQLFLRPNEPYGDRLGIPNEDAQSLVFDATTLFERDKFSGFDRIEGGTRANLGFRYSGDLGGGWTANAIFGQSFHLAGRNPYADPDLVNVGAFSGLETDRSDYVGQIGIGTPIGVNFIAGARFDKDTFKSRRTDLTASYASPFLSLSTRYSFIAKQPGYGISERDRQEVSLGASARLAEHWRVFGAATYDIEHKVLVRRAVGFGYDDLECFAITFSYNEREHARTREVTRNIGFQISLRTLGDIGTTTGVLGGF